jgi:hypothetical protein
MAGRGRLKARRQRQRKVRSVPSDDVPADGERREGRAAQRLKKALDHAPRRLSGSDHDYLVERAGCARQPTGRLERNCARRIRSVEGGLHDRVAKFFSQFMLPCLHFRPSSAVELR